MAIGVKIPILSEFNSKGFKAAYAEFKKLETTSEKVRFAMKKAFSPAGIATMTSAIGTVTYALVDMMKAAADDAREQAILANALKNTVGATDETVASVEDLISKMQMATGVSDSQLRVGFQNLARQTNDLTESISLMTLAVDISIGTGKDLETVTTALGKAYNGNIGALTRLGIPIDEATKKSGDFDRVIQKLTDTFGGAAAANADTLAGKMDILNQKFNEQKEEIGTKTIPLLTNLMNAFNNLDDGAGKIRGGIQAVKNEFKAFGDAAAEMASQLPGLGFLWNGQSQEITANENAAQNAADAFARLQNELYGVYDALFYGKKALNWTVTVGLPDLNAHLESLGYSTKITKIETSGFSRAVEEAEPPLVRYAKALEETQKQLSGTISGMLSLSDAAQKKGVSGFVQGVMGQASQIKNLAKNLTTLGERGLNPAAIQGIMSLDLGTAASLAQDLVNSAFSGRMIKNLNRAYGTITTAATQFGQSMGGYMMTGGQAPVNIETVQVVTNDPKKMVDALRSYGRRSGPIPIAVTGSF